MAVEDASLTRSVQRELCRRYVDMSMVDIRVIHGICYLRGTMQKLRSHPEVDLDHESEVIRKILRAHHGIRDVVWEVRAMEATLEDRMRRAAAARREPSF